MSSSVINCPGVRALINLALNEDMPFGDCTAALLPDTKKVSAKIISREPLVFCGAELISLIVQEAGSKITVEALSREGSAVPAEKAVIQLFGSAQDILRLERTMLNFLQRLCGVATMTRGVVQKAKGLTVLDTRKTMPGYRILDKYAVRMGGGKNHRMSLSDMVLVKNNHVDAAGGMKKVLTALYATKAPYLPVQVEVRSMAEIKAALPFAPTSIMLDNFSDKAIAEAVPYIRLHNKQVLIEASGGITQERFLFLKRIGVDTVSMGALTTQARNVDISLRVK